MAYSLLPRNQAWCAAVLLVGGTLEPLAVLGQFPVNAPTSCNGNENEYDRCIGLPKCDTCVPVPCGFADWEDWKDGPPCSGLCIRKRDIGKQNNECGLPCSGPKIEAMRCQSTACGTEKDCSLSDWEPWSTCANQEDQKYRTRTATPPALGGRSCLASTKETAPCYTAGLVDCAFDNWHEWTHCSKSCGGGRQTRIRRVLTPAANGGFGCSGVTHQVDECSKQDCGNKTNCEMGEWGQWSGCNSGSPTQTTRTRQPRVPGGSGGIPCNASVKETKPCVSSTEAAACNITDWSNWMACDKTCEGGQQTRVRTLLTPNGRVNMSQCNTGSMREVIPCGSGSCNPSGPGDCRALDWHDWSPCSEGCGYGIKSRKRDIAPATTGAACVATLEEVARCENRACLKSDCKWADWDAWSACSVTCGGGSSRRSRHIAVSPTGGGQLCAAQTKEEIGGCGLQPCNQTCVDGQWADWMPWGRCSASCDGGYMSRHRVVRQEANDCGKAVSGPEQEYAPCKNLPPCIPSKDCTLSDWNDWGACTSTCFGIRERHRTISQYKVGDGKACPNVPLGMVEACNPAANATAPQGCDTLTPKRDCILDNWSPWTVCSVTCRKGQQTRSRHIIQAPAHEGAACANPLQETAECVMNATCSGIQHCVDCKWAAWSDWGGCSNGGQMYRQRFIEKMPNNCGTKCAAQDSREIAPCASPSAVAPTLYCAWSEWSSYSACPTGCGAAMQRRHRTLQVKQNKPPNPVLFTGTGNIVCTGQEAMLRQCPAQASCQSCTPSDCSLGTWSNWTNPTPEGLCYRQRTISKSNNECGAACNGTLVESKVCQFVADQPLDCILGGWSAWTQCSHPGQQRYRQRAIRQMPHRGGQPCAGTLSETSGCFSQLPLPVDCNVTTWTDWNDCTQSCGGGWHVRTRRIAAPALHGGTACTNSLEELEACSTAPCSGAAAPRDCALGSWGDWGLCNNDEQRMRERRIQVDATKGGQGCTGELQETVGCSHLRTDCVVSDWASWMPCDKTCTGGQTARHRQVHQWPRNGGALCPPMLSMTEVAACNTATPCCVNVNCTMDVWSSWSACSQTCGTGLTTRNRTVLTKRAGVGYGCEGATTEALPCPNPTPCKPKDCTWGNWTDWGACSKSCGGGYHTRSRVVVAYPEYGGAACQAQSKEEVAPCNSQSCSAVACVDGTWGLWSDWEPCSRTCDGGITWRSRPVARTASTCGKPAEGASRQVASCNQNVNCTQSSDCLLTDWDPWSACSATCDGTKTRARRIRTEGAGYGKYCEAALKEVAPCNPDKPGDPMPAGCTLSIQCVLDTWSPWSNCSAKCSTGQVMRERKFQGSNSGGCNATLAETMPCDAGPCIERSPCAEDCRWGEWGPWGACDKCAGQMYRHRHIETLPVAGGTPCTMNMSEETRPCPRDCNHSYTCIWTSWGPWSSCTRTCEDGQRVRKRMLMPSSTSPVPGTNTSRRLWVDYEQLSSEAKHDAEAERFRKAAVAFSAGGTTLLVMLALVRASHMGKEGRLRQ